MWLEWLQFKDTIKDAQPPQLTSLQCNVVTAWQLMDGKLHWPSLDSIIVYLEIEEVELFIDGLKAIKEWQAQE